MPIATFQVTFPTDSALPADYITNTWHFDSTAVIPGSDPENVRDMLADFYTAAPSAGGSALSSYQPSYMGGPAIIKAYWPSEPAPRVPFYEDTFAWNPVGTSPLPAEVAVCLSFQAERISGQNQASRRNRVYLGPFIQNIVGTDGRLTSAFQTQVQRSAQDLFDAAGASLSWSWHVYSPTTNSSFLVDNGWVDDAFDTQRRRGVRASTRLTFS